MNKIQTTSSMYVGSLSDLNKAIDIANGFSQEESMTIIVQQNITLDGMIHSINTKGSLTIQSNQQNNTKGSLTVQSNQQNFVIDGGIANLGTANQSGYQGFIILNGIVALQNLTLNNMLAQGPCGCMGAGGALFVAKTSNYNPVVTITNVNFTNCIALGGSSLLPGGLTVVPGGQGGLGGQELGSEGENGSSGNIRLPTGTNVFGATITNDNLGYFGTVNIGAGGQYGKGTYADGQPGSTPPQASSSGYGAGTSAGGGGGGGGGGGAAGDYTDAWRGADGGYGGLGGASGFGGGSNYDAGGDPGDLGLASSDGRKGGDGGAGGTGQLPGIGASLGGAIFIMDNADVTFTGSNIISGNQVISPDYYPNIFSASATGGAGIFLQGSGQLTFNIPAGKVFTIEDEVIDETGLVSQSRAGQMDGEVGPDGLSTGGGEGKWTINKTGSGTLTIKNHSVGVGITAVDGYLDLTECINNGKQNLTLQGKASLVQLRTVDTLPSLAINNLVMEESTTLHLNAHSNIVIESLNCSTLNIVLDSTGFVVGKPVKVINTTTPIDKKLKVNISDGYIYNIDNNSISIIMNSK